MGRFGRMVGGCLVAVVVSVMAASCQTPPGGSTSSRFTQVDPALTGPEIRHETINSNLVFTPTGVPRQQLVVLFNGTGAGPLALQSMGATLANDGYHVLVLRYDSDLGTLGACPDSVASTDPDCFRTFRSEVLFGGGVADPTGTAYDQAGLAVTAGNSVHNRLLKLVEYLRTTQPLSGWDAYQQRVDGSCTTVNTTYGPCEIDWTKVIAGGHSQGAGVALYLAKFFPLERVMMMSGPFDSFALGGSSYAVAPWITEAPLQVPASDILVLSHVGDPAIGRFRSVEDALGVTGPEVLVNTGSRPYSGSHRLVTSVIPSCPLDSAPKHNSTATDGCSPAEAHTSAWRYMAAGA